MSSRLMEDTCADTLLRGYSLGITVTCVLYTVAYTVNIQQLCLKLDILVPLCAVSFEDVTDHDALSFPASIRFKRYFFM